MKNPKWMNSPCLKCTHHDVCGILADFKGDFPEECDHFTRKQIKKK